MNTIRHARPQATGSRAGRVAARLFVAASMGLSLAHADPGPFVLPGSGCPMAHCDARMSDTAGTSSPMVARRIAIDRSSAGAKGGLGCVSNLRLVACTSGASDASQPNLTVYDADGRRIWDDGGILGSTAWLSAPLISEAGHVIAADQDRLLRADPLGGVIQWQVAKPDQGTPISPVLIGADGGMVLLATKAPAQGGRAELSVWDTATGALLSHQPILDPLTGVGYATLNTPAVRGNRAYVLASAEDSGDDGRLYAIDVCESADCGGRGTVRIAWHFGFDGPSSASPVLIGNRLFFDGLRGSRGTFHAVDDLGASAAAVWEQRFAARFGASAAQDPRGGLWVAPWQSGSLLRLDEGTGAVVQTVDLSAANGLPPGYSVVTATTVSTSAAGAVVLTAGIQVPGRSSTLPTYLSAVDVSSSETGAALWIFQVAPNARINAATGQSPIVINDAGARRVVVKGTRSSTFFIGEP
jgi:hypothetical protein